MSLIADFSRQKVLKRVKRDHREEETRKNSNKSSRRKNFGHELARHRRNRVFFGVHGPSDILYDAMWYIKEDFKNRQHTTNILQYNKDKHLRHMNVEAAWDRGYSGAGVVVTILDDGIETDHPDLKRNYDKDASWDMNDGDDDPMMRYTPGNTNRYNQDTVTKSSTKNRHGTRCAGEVAATADNGICVPGIAFNAKIGGSILPFHLLFKNLIRNSYVGRGGNRCYRSSLAQVQK